MGFTWSTFILEIINFLVLVWVLKRILFLPIKRAILQRRKSIQEDLDKAKGLREEAIKLQAKYENRLNDWEIEKQEKMTLFKQEIEKERVKQLDILKENLKKEREIFDAREQNRIQLLIDSHFKESMTLATQFLVKILTRLASPELEKKLIDIFCEDILHLMPDELSSLLEVLDRDKTIYITSTYQLVNSQKEILLTTLKKIMGDHLQFNFRQDSTLLSGLQLNIGAHLLQANLRDELKFFKEINRGSF